MKSATTGSPKLVKWQEKLLPFMLGMLITLTLFFFVASFIQIYYLHGRIESSPTLDLSPALNMLENTGPIATNRDKLDYSRWKTLAILEGHALQRRYHQANVLLMSRIWTRYLGFVTGMILALVGSMFILGKLRESETKLDAQGVWKLSISTASPGLILAVLGTLLMLTTIVTHFEIEVKDGPSYTPAWFSSPLSDSAPLPLAPPSEQELLDEMKKKLGTQQSQK